LQRGDGKPCPGKKHSPGTQPKRSENTAKRGFSAIPGKRLPEQKKLVQSTSEQTGPPPLKEIAKKSKGGEKRPESVGEKKGERGEPEKKHRQKNKGKIVFFGWGGNYAPEGEKDRSQKKWLVFCKKKALFKREKIGFKNPNRGGREKKNHRKLKGFCGNKKTTPALKIRWGRKKKAKPAKVPRPARAGKGGEGDFSLFGKGGGKKTRQKKKIAPAGHPAAKRECPYESPRGEKRKRPGNKSRRKKIRERKPRSPRVKKGKKGKDKTGDPDPLWKKDLFFFFFEGGKKEKREYKKGETAFSAG